ncbi:MAG: hypothetical protein JHD07_02490 [Bradyrhizobium sp.]|nr:hypothetical protein [Bradyrhizobium sp.]
MLTFTGNDSFTYVASDGTSNSTPVTVSLTVNDGPNAYNFQASSANTTISLSGTAGASIAFSAPTGVQKLAGVVNNVIGGSGNDTISGNNNGNILIGGAGNDVITGGSGNDVISGDNGTNRLKGGAGSDTFVFKEGNFNTTIADFDPTKDVLDFQGFAGLTVDQILADSSPGNNTVITLGVNEHIQLLGVSQSQLLNLQPFEFNI